MSDYNVPHITMMHCINLFNTSSSTDWNTLNLAQQENAMKNLFQTYFASLHRWHQRYCYENGNGVLKIINKAPKIKIMGLFTWLMNKEKYCDNFSIKK